ncbi:MAG: exosortase A [Pseudomonadota bacterium]
MLIDAFRSHSPHYSWRAAITAYLACALGIFFLCQPGLKSMAHQWFTSSAYGHGALAAPIALGLILWRRNHVKNERPALWLAALPLLAGAAALSGLGRALDAQLVEHLAIVFLLITSAACYFGRRITRQWAFPLLFLFFMVPAGESLTPFLQRLTAIATTALLNIGGLSATLNDLVITTNSGLFHIAEGCSGLRFLLAALVTGSLFSYYAYDRWDHRLTFLAAAISIALIANIFRVALIILIAAISGQNSPLVNDHLMVGWVFYAATLTALIVLGLRFRAGASHA